MPWKVVSPMSLRLEFVTFASREDANVAALCRQFKIARKTGYKWLDRYRQHPDHPLADQSRRPLRSPHKASPRVEQHVTSLRLEHPAWGARKLRRRLQDLGHDHLPARSTINDILRRHELIRPDESLKHAACQRFERLTPNELWQMDFKGHFATDAGRCHPLTILDDCSRINVLLKACDNERSQTVQAALIDAMRRYGMPVAILTDNGSPWGACGQGEMHTALSVWLIRHGVRVLHGRPAHPQTQGKEERFHRTLKAEAISTQRLRDVRHCQNVFDAWREVYNHQRPHEAIDTAVPASRYRPSERTYTESPAPIEYGSGDAVRRVCEKGFISYRGQSYKIGRAFVGQRVAVRPTAEEGRMQVMYCHQRIGELDLRGADQQG
jgi:transposase InsO family protein